MHVLAMRIELRFPSAGSLKAKRACLRPLLDGGRQRFPVAMAEVDHLDSWQRSAVGVSAVSGSATMAAQLIDDVERFVWSMPDLEVLSAERHWLELES
jgi:uncharacterized protein YlxP (DUF503 family)